METSSVEITFDCLPLRSIHRFDTPVDASDEFMARCERVRAALRQHGMHNTYFLENGTCTFQLSNQPGAGILQFLFEGTITTDDNDEHSSAADLTVELWRESCHGITEPVIQWFRDTVTRAVMLDFNRYLAADDGSHAKQRLVRLNMSIEQCTGYVGMGL